MIISLTNNLKVAKYRKNDEFYTKYIDIEKELKNYHNHFKSKIVYCNCDNPNISSFVDFFIKNFKFLKIKKLIATFYNPIGNSYKLEVTENGINKSPLKENGDFRSSESIEFLKESDIIVTNPPFSLFREFLLELIKFEKKFLIVGNINTISYNETFRLIKKNKLWLGYNSIRYFIQPNGIEFETARTFWYTNLEIQKRTQFIKFTKKYNQKDYPKYDNFNAINVDKVQDIPIDYHGFIGVPITFLNKFNPNQFDIIGKMSTTKQDDINFGYPFINGKKKYARIIIKKKL